MCSFHQLINYASNSNGLEVTNTLLEVEFFVLLQVVLLEIEYYFRNVTVLILQIFCTPSITVQWLQALSSKFDVVQESPIR